MIRLPPCFLRTLLRWLLPVALLLAQHGVWAHGFTHDLAKIAGHSQNDARHDCCLPFQAAGDAACAALALPGAIPLPVAARAVIASGQPARLVLAYVARAPPLSS